MKVLVVGSGGREHALAWKLKQSRKVDKLFCAPGSSGIGQIARCVKIKATNIRGLADFAARNKIGLTVVGPEAPLVQGIADEFRRRRLKLFGPNRMGAQIESSKVFCKEFLRKYHIPTASFRVFGIAAEAIGFCKTVKYPVVVKADGLAAGKGVIIARTFEQAATAIEQLMIKRAFGKAGNRIVIESFLQGQEVSIMAVTDGKRIVTFPSSQDHKQAFEGDRGPNTGGMGAFCPSGLTDGDVAQQITESILQPTIKGLAAEGISYKGVLYAGLMMTENGPSVLEYNCRFGDPETQAILPLMKSDLLDLLLAAVSGKLTSAAKTSWHPGAAACVVMASQGYPGKYVTGVEIAGISKNNTDSSCMVFHAGTIFKNKKWQTSGGRVLGVTAHDKTLKDALNKAYRKVGSIRFRGAMYRKDIGFRVLKPVRTDKQESQND
ncbi:MAG: phosphoribosylamine--glycine ligase [Candidatus Zixiibacteriota bacterium]